MPYSVQAWTDSVTPVDKTHMDHIESGIATADTNATTALARVTVPTVVNGQWLRGVGGAAVWSPLATDALSATPPGSPVDGQLWSMAADANGTVWVFRYNAGSGSAYKWEFVGGPPLFAEVVASEANATTTYGVVATGGPAVTLPRPGDYDVAIGARITNNIIGATSFMSYDIGATAAVDSDAVSQYSPAISTVGPSNNVARTRRKAGLTAVILNAKYRQDLGSATGTYANRWMTAHPVRVS